MKTKRFSLSMLTVGLLATVGSIQSADASLVLNLRGDQGVTTGGGAITNWADQSGNSNNLGDNSIVANDEANNTNTINGLNVVTMDEDDVLALNGDPNVALGDTASNLPTGNSSLHGFIVLQTTDNNGSRFITFGAAGLPFTGSTYHIGMNAAGNIYSGYTSAGFLANNATPVNDGAVHIIEFSYDGTTHSVYVDGVLAPTTSNVIGGTLGSHSINLGFNQNAFIPSENFLGSFAEIQLYNNSLSEAERQAVGIELEQRWGIDAAYIPEPASIALFGMGALLIGKRRHT